MATVERPCLMEGCAGTVTFNLGVLARMRSRTYSTCPECGTEQYLTKDGVQDQDRIQDLFG